MKLYLLLLSLLLASAASAATISSSTCSSPSNTTGCVTSYVPSTVAVAVQVTGTWSGTLVFEGSNDTALPFVALRGYPVGGGAFVTSTTSTGAWTVPTGGLLYLRVRATSWTSGVATVTLASTTSSVVTDYVRAVGAGFGAVAIEPPDGGFGVVITRQDVDLDINAVRSSVTVRTDVGTALAVSGLDGGATIVSLAGEKVDFTEASLARLAVPPCQQTFPLHFDIPGTTAWPMPPLEDGGNGTNPARTAVLIGNFDQTHTLYCSPRLPDGGLPTSAARGAGWPVVPGGTLKPSGLDGGAVIYCYNPGGDPAEAAVWEDICG